MKLRLIFLITLMSISSIGRAQIDVHSHMIPESYLAAVKAHLQTAHFKKYKEGTASMVKSLKLTDTTPLVTAILN